MNDDRLPAEDYFVQQIVDGGEAFEPWDVYGDYLQEGGSPRGDLIKCALRIWRSDRPRKYDPDSQDGREFDRLIKLYARGFGIACLYECAEVRELADRRCPPRPVILTSKEQAEGVTKNNVSFDFATSFPFHNCLLEWPVRTFLGYTKLT